MHNELNEKKGYNNIREIIHTDQKILDIELYKCRSNFENANKSIISDLFYFDQGTITTCLNCRVSIYSFSMYNFIIFPLEKTRLYKLKKESNFLNVNIFDCFECLTAEERNIPGNTIFCNSCKTESDYIISHKISSFPEILTIILNRGRNLEFDVEFQISYIIDNLERYMIKFNNIMDKQNIR